MTNLLISLASLLVGIWVTIFVSKYYFKRTVNKELTPYIQFLSSFFSGVDSSVREALKIAYKGTPVQELLEVQFLIANTGERPIRDVIRPLTLAIPTGCSILDASVLHVSPEGRDIVISQSGNSVVFTFPLLNAGEFFITKLLLHGKAKGTDFIFCITADDLPPTIPAASLPPDLIETKFRSGFEWLPLCVGLAMLLMAVALAVLVVGEWPLLPKAWQATADLYMLGYWQKLVSSILTGLLMLVFLVFGPVLIWIAFSDIDFSFPRRRRFAVPDGFRARQYYFYRGQELELFENPAPK